MLPNLSEIYAQGQAAKGKNLPKGVDEIGQAGDGIGAAISSIYPMIGSAISGLFGMLSGSGGSETPPPPPPKQAFIPPNQASGSMGSKLPRINPDPGSMATSQTPDIRSAALEEFKRMRSR